MIFTMLEIGDIFGINTDLGIDPNSTPHTDVKYYVQIILVMCFLTLYG